MLFWTYILPCQPCSFIRNYQKSQTTKIVSTTLLRYLGENKTNTHIIKKQILNTTMYNFRETFLTADASGQCWLVGQAHAATLWGLVCGWRGLCCTKNTTVTTTYLRVITFANCKFYETYQALCWLASATSPGLLGQGHLIGRQVFLDLGLEGLLWRPLVLKVCSVPSLLGQQVLHAGWHFEGQGYNCSPYPPSECTASMFWTSCCIASHTWQKRWVLHKVKICNKQRFFF